MTKSLKVTFGIAAVIILAVIVYAFNSVLTTPSGQQTPNPAPTQASGTSAVDPSKIVWNAKTMVPGTRVTFTYPKEGYYGKGVKLVNNQWSSDLPSFQEVESLYLISLPEAIGSQQTYVRVFKLEGEKNLEDVVKKLNEEGGMPLQGRYQEINGVRYFLQASTLSSDPAVYAYTAYAITNGQLLMVNIQGGFDGSNEAVTPGLVTQFLSHLDLTCKSNCSVNSAPITDASRGEQ